MQHKVCVCVCQQESSKHSNNRLNKSLRVFSAWYLLSQCAMTDSCQTAVMSLRSGDWQLQTGSGPCGETETTCTIWGWKCRLKVFHDEERGLDRAHRFIKSRLMSLQRHFTENIDLCHHLKQKAPRYDECLWRRRIHNILMIYRAVSSPYSRSLLFYQLCSAGKYNLHLFFFSVFCFLSLKKLSVFKDLVKTWIKLSRTKERPPADRVQVQVPVNKPPPVWSCYTAEGRWSWNATLVLILNLNEDLNSFCTHLPERNASSSPWKTIKFLLKWEGSFSPLHLLSFFFSSFLIRFLHWKETHFLLLTSHLKQLNL